jgi:hypothetical protein
VKLSIKEKEKPVAEKPLADQLVATVLNSGGDWREPFIRYLTSTYVPHNKIELECLVRHSKHYVLIEGKLMRKNTKEELLQKCVSQEEGVKILEIHASTCGNHAASWTLVGKAFRVGFYWPSAVADAEKLVHHCEVCQFFTK